MGKTKKRYLRQNKMNPLGIPSLREIAQQRDEFVDDSNAGPIKVIREQLQSANTEDKMNALQNLAVLSVNIAKVKLVCESDIIRIAAPLLVDKNDSIKNATAGALRNLSVCGENVCENLVDQDILTPLLALLSQYANENTWVPTFDKKFPDQLDCKSDTYLQSISLLWNLCESTSVALDNFNQSHLLRSFIRCLDITVFGIDISIAVAQCILVVSEDNPIAWSVLSNFEPEFICLLNLEEDKDDNKRTFLRTLSAGIISNVPALAAAHSSLILNALSKTLNINNRNILGRITSRLPLKNSTDDHQSESVEESNLMEADESSEAANIRRRRMDRPSETEIEVKHVGFLLEAQRVAAEVISNLCSPDDEEWVDDSDDSGDDKIVHDYEVESNESLNGSKSLETLSIEILEAVKSLGIIEKLWQRAQPLPANVVQILQESSPILFKKLLDLHVSTLLCLQNLCNSMTTEDLGGPNAIYSVWLEVGQRVFQIPPDPLITEPGTSLMRATLEHLKKSPELFNQIALNDLQLMFNGVQQCQTSEIRANWLRMLGILGCLLPEHLVKRIMAFILEICVEDKDVWTISEGIDALMDMFADNDWKQIAVELNLINNIKEIERDMKHKVREQRATLKDRYPAVITVRSNLVRFTKYLQYELRDYRPNTNNHN